MKVGLKQWGVKTPLIVKWVAGVALAISTTITVAPVWEDNEVIQQVGAICMGVSLVLPKFFGITSLNTETDEEAIV